MRAILLSTFVFAIPGCGPMTMPMAHRVEDPETQQSIENGWQQALTPVERLDRQEWLDAFVGLQIFQVGVDKLDFRSEKKFSGGLVVMEITFDRSLPANDLFRVRVLDHERRIVREERYSRDDVEQTYRVLFSNNTVPSDSDDSTQDETERERRWKRIYELFPEFREQSEQADDKRDAADDD